MRSTSQTTLGRDRAVVLISVAKSNTNKSRRGFPAIVEVILASLERTQNAHCLPLPQNKVTIRDASYIHRFRPKVHATYFLPDLPSLSSRHWSAHIQGSQAAPPLLARRTAPKSRRGEAACSSAKQLFKNFRTSRPSTLRNSCPTPSYRTYLTFL